MAATNLALSGLAVGLGALYPNFDEDNPARIIAGLGGTLSFLLSLAYIGLVTAVMAVALGGARHFSVLSGYDTLLVALGLVGALTAAAVSFANEAGAAKPRKGRLEPPQAEQFLVEQPLHAAPEPTFFPVPVAAKVEGRRWTSTPPQPGQDRRRFGEHQLLELSVTRFTAEFVDGHRFTIAAGRARGLGADLGCTWYPGVQSRP